MDILLSILLIIGSYLYGSIPFALVIGKLFYNIDIRSQGSGNLGGTNAGRVLGSKAGAAVIVLDTSKCFISVMIAKLFIHYFGVNPNMIYLAALSCIIGHCYPIFAQFKGGKAVSVTFGYILATNLVAFLISIAIFLIILKVTKYVSLSSILSTTLFVLISPFVGYTTIGVIANLVMTALLIYKHRENIVRIKNGTENKIRWM